MLQSNIDTCLFIVDKVICILYGEYLIFWAKDKSDMPGLATKPHDIGIDIKQEGDVAGFMGVNLE